MRRTKTTVWGAGLAIAIGCGGDDTRGDGMDGGGIGVPTAAATDGDSGAGTEAGPGDADETAEGDDDGSGNACGDGSVDFTFIWIANSPEGTVSKIDTRTAVEVARYRTGPEDGPDPSRTAVNLSGDVAVLNRAGSVTKIAALLERCVDQNGDGTISTSAGPSEVLPWGEDECVLWNQALPHFEPEPGDHVWGARPVAWDGGVPNPEDSCDRGPSRLWVGWYEGVGTNVAGFRRLDGTTGATLDEVAVPEWSPIPLESSRPYGAATDRDGNLWVLGKPYQLLRIDGQTLTPELHLGAAPDGFYGLALDGNGAPWIAQCNGWVRRYDDASGGFRNVGDAGGCLRGLAIDTEGQAWIAANDPCRLVQVDVDSETIVADDIALPGCGEPVGVSVDVDGMVWVVDREANRAYKIDPQTHAVQAEVGGLVSPYTYSDMTGAGLSLQFNPEG
ncbi:MAG: hypothetical protein AAF721_28215 [Myxococcota bacterium]